MDYTLENFISYCDEMTIADESFKESIKNSRIGKVIKAAIDWIIKHIKIIGQRIKDAWRALTGKATSREENFEKKYNEAINNLEKQISNLKFNKSITEFELAGALKDLKKMEEHNDELFKDYMKQNDSYMHTINNQRKEIQKLQDELNQLTEIRDKESSEYKQQIQSLQSKINQMIEQEREKIIKMADMAKESLRGSSNGIIIDTRGLVQPTLVAYPKAAKLISDVTNLVKYVNIELTTGEETLLTNNPSVISDIEEKVNECYAICKSIYRHDDESGDVDNPKRYSRNDIVAFYNGMNESHKKLLKIYDDVSKLSSKIDNPNPNVVKVLNIACKLISVIESYVSIIYRVSHEHFMSPTPNYTIANFSGYKRKSGETGRKRNFY